MSVAVPVCLSHSSGHVCASVGAPPVAGLELSAGYDAGSLTPGNNTLVLCGINVYIQNKCTPINMYYKHYTCDFSCISDKSTCRPHSTEGCLQPRFTDSCVHIIIL